MRTFARIVSLAVVSLSMAGCARGPDPDRLQGDVQSRLDTFFGRQVLTVDTLRRQGSAPYRAAADGAKQVIVYYNGVFRFAEAYDPSDWQGLSPAMLASALGAADGGVTGLKAGPNPPGAELRAHGSIVYRRVGEGWQPADVVGPRPPPAAGATAAATAVAQGTSSDELVRRLAEIVQKVPARQSRDDQIIAEELGRALDNIRLRTGQSQADALVAAGPEGGEYWRFWSSVVSRVGAKGPVKVAASAGSVENAFLVDKGDARFGIVQSDVAAAALTGAGLFSGTGPLGHLRAVAALFPEPVHVVVRADSGIESLAGLRGRRVALGDPASGTRQTAARLLEAAGVSFGEIEQVDAVSPQASLDLLLNGEVDGVVQVVSAPWRQLEVAMEATPLRLLPLDLQTRVEIGLGTHGLFPLAIPARTYPGQDEPLPTVAATALLVAGETVPDGLVTRTLDVIYASAASGGAGVQAARLSKERALEGVTIPLHPAAARYFGAKRPTPTPVAPAAGSGS